MTPPDTRAELSPLKRAFLALEDARARLAQAEGAAREPIAVIGMGCRVPGADDPAAFWRLMHEGRDAVSPIPRERFDIDAYYDPDTEVPGRIAVREAGFIRQVDGFDPGFFGISPREAHGMDPQQRLLLEVSWEALEHAAQAPDRLSKSATGVYFGLCSTDYASMILQTGDAALLDSHYTSGVAHSVASGRISYLLGLQGPSLTVDTACSSSLVAVHLACQALRAGECRMALAGGANLMLSADLFIAFSHSRMLAPDGRCKTFDAAADGFARGEGAGVVVLKRLADAQADGDRILAVIRGSAVNQDGPSSGLTAPNGPAQEAVIREALARAGAVPGDVGYIEAHGTGTQLGDPLEVQALGKVFGPGRDAAQPLWLGSVKTNLGHLEAAAGVTGLIKVVLALQHQQIPAHLHFRQPSPHIAWSELPLRVPTALTPWPAIGGRRLAGVSSFGFSGTNAHVVVEQAPQALVAPAAEPADAGVQLYVLSAREPAALRELAARHAAALRALPDTPLASACHTANTGRAHFAHRAAIAAHDISELCERLDALARGDPATGLRVAQVQRRDPPRVAFLFTGQGSQYAGMARGLFDSMPVFRDALQRCADALEGRLARPLLELLFAADAPAGEIDRTEFTQPALFAVEYALAELWRSWGVTPSVVMGHSVGEVAAACVAGVMSLADALHLVCERARLMGALPAGGAMAAIQAAHTEVAPQVAAHAAVLAIAAINAPGQTVVSGAAAQVDALCQAFTERGVRCQRLPVSHAFHSPLVEPMLDAFERVVAGLRLAAPRLRLISNLSGALAVGDEIRQAAYWRRHVREPVRFADGVRSLAALRPEVCIEIGPQPALLALLAAGFDTVLPERVASLRKGRADREQMLDALASLYLEGAEIDWRAVQAGQTRAPIELPTYPFQRERHWFSARPMASAGQPRGRATGHPLLGVRLRSATEQSIYEGHIGADAPRYVAQHRVQGQVVLPATAYLELLLAAAADRFGADADAGVVEHITLQTAMRLADGPAAARTVQLLLDAPRDGAVAARLCSLPEEAGDSEEWTCHVTARLPLPGAADAAPAKAAPGLDDARRQCVHPVDGDAFYAGLAQRALVFGPAFQSVRRLWRGAGQALGEVALHADLEPERSAYRLHPVLLDGCLQVLAAALSDETDDALFLPMSIGRYRWRGRAAGACWAHVVADPAFTGETRRAELRVFDADGGLIAELLDVRLKRASADTLGRQGERALDDCLYQVAWRAVPAVADAPPEALPVAAMAAAAAAAVEPLRAAVGLEAFDTGLPRLDRLCAEFIVQALQRMGWAPAPGERVDSAGLAVRLKVVQRHRALLGRLLAILADDGWLVRDGSGWVVQRVFGTVQPDRTLAEFAATRPLLAAELELTGRTGAELAAALRGECDPLQLLFPAGSTETAERVYRDSPPARLFNGLVAEAVAAAAQGRDPDRPLRILEIGAGTGGTTAHVLPRLVDGAVSYTFTDIGPSFVARARQRFGAHRFMQFQVFDLEQDPRAQGLAEAGFDVILASNVIHATSDLRRALARVRQLLAPGGVLVLLEATVPQPWFDLTVGLTEGWWCFTDHELRPDYPTLPTAGWLRLLGECGFGPVHCVAGNPAQPGALGLNALLLAQVGAPVAAAPERDWLVFADSAGLAEQLAERLRARGDACLLVRAGDRFDAAGDSACTIDPRVPEHLARLIGTWHAARRRWHGVIHAASLALTAGDTLADLDATRQCGVVSAMHLAQALVAHNPAPRLWLLTRGAQAVAPGTLVAPMAASLWGLGKALRLEHPELRTVCIDLDPQAGTGEVDALLAELADSGAEGERALRSGTRHVARLVRLPRPLPVVPNPNTAPWRLVPAQPGSLERLVRTPHARGAPGPGEVGIAVEATGLNFKDVLNVLGLYPGNPGPLGGECAGRVAALGAGVTHLAVGDPVLALASGSFASHAVTRAEFVHRRPPGMGAAEGASFAIAYLTAEFCLSHLAGLRAGQRVLIHAAAGGVGLAAVRVAQRAGAEVIATAGSPAKRALLHSIGVAHVFDSRSAAFAEPLLALTGGRGVDVVLNSLAGELIAPTFSVLARGGCFLEIGKRGIKSTDEVAALNREIRYHIVDWGDTAVREPALIGAMLARLVEAVGQGELAPLPRHEFSLDDAAPAFRFMAQARHTGKIVVRHADAPPWQPQRSGSYLVSGGLSGLGLQTAAWLAERGAGRLVLLGRRGATPEAAPVLERLCAEGVDVMAEAVDVTDEAALRAVLQRVRSAGPPLRGVWHSAGVLDDAGLLQQDDTRYARVFAPKVHGAVLLDRLTRGDPLDCFVMFSSVAGVLGSAGQSNHSAANAVLDALAHQRVASGLPALSIDWGAWAEVGAAADRGITERIAQQGLGTISKAQGLQAMQRLIDSATVQAAVLSINWPRYLARVVPGGTSALLSEVVGGATAADASWVPLAAPPASIDLPAQLASAPPARRRTILAAFVRERALRALGVDPAKAVDPRTPLGDLGLDSLLAVELRNTLGAALGRSLPATLLFDHPTLDALTDCLLAELFTPAAAPAAPIAAVAASGGTTIVGSIEDLSDEEVDRQLAARSRNPVHPFP